MTLESTAERRDILAVALAAAREGAQLVEAGWRKHPRAEHKGPIDLVTKFDRDCEELLRARLGEKSIFPVVGEEQGGQRAPGQDEATWYVDPIDGTTNFVHGHPFYAVSIGLLLGTTPVLGVVVAPSLRVEWAGIAGGVATRNGERCQVSAVAQFSDALLATGFPYDRATSAENNFDAFVAIKKRAQAVRRCGSAAIDMCLVADGTYDGYWEQKLKVWDVAAGAAIVLAAGGKLSSYDGGPVNITTGHVVATNGYIHEALIRELASV
jgi:myo-inositol-1(or 4)-monophosphatase